MSDLPARAANLDDLDLRIIAELEVDGRRPVVEIARALDEPTSTVQRRLEALIRNRVIMIAPYADSAKLGLPIHVHLNLKVSLAHYEQALDAVVALEEVRWVATTTGAADIVAEGFFASTEHLHQFIKKRLAQIEGITDVQTSVILNVAKFTFHWAAIRQRADQEAPPHIRLSTPAAAYEADGAESPKPPQRRARRSPAPDLGAQDHD